MTVAVRKLTEQAEAASKAAEVIHAVRDALTTFRDLSTVDPQTVFGHTVREHREAVQAFDKLLRELCFDGQQIEQVANAVGFGSEAVTIIRAAHMRLRVLRTLASLLSGDLKALDVDATVRAEVEQVLNARANVNARKWTDEERDAFAKGTRAFSPEFEARLDGS